MLLWYIFTDEQQQQFKEVCSYFMTIAEQYTAKNYHRRQKGVTSTWSEMQTAKHRVKYTCITKMQNELMCHHKRRQWSISTSHKIN